MASKKERHDLILELLGRNRIDSQEQLADLMDAEGTKTTQSTLSRDLRELGVLKGPEGYRAPDAGAHDVDRLRRTAEELRPLVQSVDAGGTVVVLRCAEPGQAADVAARLDGADTLRTVSVVAVGATALAIARTPAYARDLVRAFRRRGR